MLTILYAMIGAAIAMRIATFNRNGGDYRPLPAMLAWLLTVAAGSGSGSTPSRARSGTDPAATVSSHANSAGMGR